LSSGLRFGSGNSGANAVEMRLDFNLVAFIIVYAVMRIIITNGITCEAILYGRDSLRMPTIGTIRGYCTTFPGTDRHTTRFVGSTESRPTSIADRLRDTRERLLN
jgi:hypothetical protein